jgi:hypothetical protein
MVIHESVPSSAHGINWDNIECTEHTRGLLRWNGIAAIYVLHRGRYVGAQKPYLCLTMTFAVLGESWVYLCCRLLGFYPLDLVPDKNLLENREVQ